MFVCLFFPNYQKSSERSSVETFGGNLGFHGLFIEQIILLVCINTMVFKNYSIFSIPN